MEAAEGLRFGGKSYDDNQIGKGSMQVRMYLHYCMHAHVAQVQRGRAFEFTGMELRTKH